MTIQSAVLRLFAETIAFSLTSALNSAGSWNVILSSGVLISGVDKSNSIPGFRAGIGSGSLLGCGLGCGSGFKEVISSAANPGGVTSLLITSAVTSSLLSYPSL